MPVSTEQSCYHKQSDSHTRFDRERTGAQCSAAHSTVAVLVVERRTVGRGRAARGAAAGRTALRGRAAPVSAGSRKGGCCFWFCISILRIFIRARAVDSTHVRFVVRQRAFSLLIPFRRSAMY